MKKLFTALFFLVWICSVYAQNYNWITPNQTYLKMYVINNGIHRIDKTDFTAAGIPVSGIDPRTVKLYYKGNQIPIYFFGESDGTFDDADYFDFYGSRNYGGLTNTYDEIKNVVYTTDEYYNLYSDTSVYWIGWGGANGLRFADYNNSSSTLYSLDYYNATQHYENNTLYSLGQNVNSGDYNNFLNDKYRGEGWYWMLMQNNNQISQAFNATLLSNSPQQCKLKLFSFPVRQNTTITNEHRLVVKVNSTQFDSLRFDNFNRLDTTLNFSSSLLAAGSNTALIRYLPVDASMQTYFDFVEITFPRRFEFDSNYVGFRSELTNTDPTLFYVKGAVSSNPVSIYDIKNGKRIINYSISNDTLYFVGMANGQFEINNKTITGKPLRIKQRSVPNLVTNSTGADYVVIYNKIFEAQAEQLRAYRNTHDGFRSFKAEIEDIYDIFNFGIEDPVAVRRFNKNAYETWTLPKIRFICLFGRGSLDPKKILSSSVYYQNYIPVYGNPTTDGYFANFNFGTFTYYPQVSIGRLPAYNTQEAQNMVNNIIAYESQTPQNWVKKQIFVTGGYTSQEQQVFIAQTNYFLNSYIINPPVSSYPVKIFLNDSTGLVSYNYSDSVKNSIDRGALLVNYMAHAGNGYWDYVFDDPSVLSNGAKSPVVFSMTCLTGKSADANSRSYGEKYVSMSGKGSIGFIGTTGWSLSSTGNTFNDYLLNGFALDTLRRTGDIIRFAARTMSVDSNVYAPNNTIGCYNLLGDPAVKLILPAYPEFEIQNQDYSISDANPPMRKKISLYMYPKNLGIGADSCKLRMQITKNNKNYLLKDTIVRNFGFIDTLAYNFSLDSVGNYSLKYTIDPDNWYPGENKTNNVIYIPLSARNVTFYPLKPQDNQVIYGDSAEITGLNPNIDLYRNNVKLLLQVDTSSSFNSSVVQTFFRTGFTGITSKFRFGFPLADTGAVYFWRLRTVLNNDSLQWSDIYRFRRGNSPADVKPNTVITDSNITISRYKLSQYNSGEISFLNLSPGYGTIQGYSGRINARSQLFLVYAPTYITVNMRNFSFDNLWRGLNLAKISRITGRVREIRNFRVNSTASSDSIVNFLNTFDTLSYLVAVKNYSSPGGTTLTAAAIAKFKQFGSTAVDTVGSFAWYNSWALISYFGATQSQKKEKFVLYPGGGADPSPAYTELFPNFIYPSGTVINVFGPAQTWRNFNWFQSLQPNSGVMFDVYGTTVSNTDSLLMANITTSNFTDLQGINALTFPKLKLVTRVEVDSISGAQSSGYGGMTFYYTGPPEIALDNNTIFKSDSIVTMGDSVGIAGYYYNVGYVQLNRHIRSFYALDGAGNKVVLRTDTVNTPLKVDSSVYIKASFKVNGLPIYKKYLNQIAVVLEIIPINQNDLYSFNNAVISTFYVKGALTDFQTEVFSDGTRLYGNDYVRSNPDMIIKLTGKSIEELINSDTTLFRIMLNGNYISLNGASKTGKGVNIIKEMDKGNFIVRFSPKLQEGMNTLNLVSGKGESYDTLKFVLNVTSEVSFRDIFNFPNPMKDNTTFTFNITGADSPGECRIKIYSVAGRVIKEIIVPGNVGMNNVYWDGRDADGDYIANGVYFYRLILKNDADKHSDIQKLVVLR